MAKSKKDDQKEGEDPQEPSENGTDSGKESPEGENLLTQAEHQELLNQAVTQRSERMLRKTLREIGVDSPEQLKEALDKLKQFEESQLSEAERIQKQVEEAEETARQAQAERDKAIADARETLIRAEFIAEAGKQGAKHPGDAFSLADLSGVAVNDDGVVEGVEGAVKALIESERLPLRGKPQAPNLDAGAGGAERPGEKPVNLTEEEMHVARSMGLTPEEYAEFKK
jgi:hypothetical protein